LFIEEKSAAASVFGMPSASIILPSFGFKQGIPSFIYQIMSKEKIIPKTLQVEYIYETWRSIFKVFMCMHQCKHMSATKFGDQLGKPLYHVVLQRSSQGK
jgi:hypothetical protein